MDLSKYPLEKLFYFVAGIIPGLVALLIYQAANPGTFRWFVCLGFFGYRTKIALVLLAAFIIGNTMTTFLNAGLYAIGYWIGSSTAARTPFMPAHTYETAPWRDPRWRTVVKERLGVNAPSDTLLMTERAFEQRKGLVDSLPPAQREAALADLSLEKLRTEINDGAWAQWYDLYHQIILEPDEVDIPRQIKGGLDFNLEAAGLYALISAAFVPEVRHWWCIVPASLWVFALICVSVYQLRQATDKWGTLHAQIRYLARAR
jgi:hypothetical protein